MIAVEILGANWCKSLCLLASNLLRERIWRVLCYVNMLLPFLSFGKKKVGFRNRFRGGPIPKERKTVFEKTELKKLQAPVSNLLFLGNRASLNLYSIRLCDCRAFVQMALGLRVTRSSNPPFSVFNNYFCWLMACKK